MKKHKLDFSNADKRRESIPTFLAFLEENPDVEEFYMQSIRGKAKKNSYHMNRFYAVLHDSRRF